MVERYVILNAEGGWLENLVVWDGNIETWKPPAGTIAKPIKEVDVTALPERPTE
jgi:hypothetical protein